MILWSSVNTGPLFPKTVFYQSFLPKSCLSSKFKSAFSSLHSTVTSPLMSQKRQRRGRRLKRNKHQETQSPLPANYPHTGLVVMLMMPSYNLKPPFSLTLWQIIWGGLICPSWVHNTDYWTICPLMSSLLPATHSLNYYPNYIFLAKLFFLKLNVKS